MPLNLIEAKVLGQCMLKAIAGAQLCPNDNQPLPRKNEIKSQGFNRNHVYQGWHCDQANH